MENKKYIASVSVVFIALGILIGWFVWGTHPAVKTTAHQMPDGSMMSDDASMQGMMDDMAKSLEGKTGDAFDKAFLDEMIIHHEGAVVMAKMVQKTSKRPELLKLAEDIITAQTGEIQMMQTWRKNWFTK